MKFLVDLITVVEKEFLVNDDLNVQSIYGKLQRWGEVRTPEFYAKLLKPINNYVDEVEFSKKSPIDRIFFLDSLCIHNIQKETLQSKYSVIIALLILDMLQIYENFFCQDEKRLYEICSMLGPQGFKRYWLGISSIKEKFLCLIFLTKRLQEKLKKIARFFNFSIKNLPSKELIRQVSLLRTVWPKELHLKNNMSMDEKNICLTKIYKYLASFYVSSDNSVCDYYQCLRMDSLDRFIFGTRFYFVEDFNKDFCCEDADTFYLLIYLLDLFKTITFWGLDIPSYAQEYSRNKAFNLRTIIINKSQLILAEDSLYSDSLKELYKQVLSPLFLAWMNTLLFRLPLSSMLYAA